MGGKGSGFRDGYQQGFRDGEATGLAHAKQLMQEATQAANEAREAVRQVAALVAELRARPPMQPLRELPMRTYVSARDVMGALACSKSMAHRLLRPAAGRTVGTGELLRVEAHTWEAFIERRLRRGRRPAA